MSTVPRRRPVQAAATRLDRPAAAAWDDHAATAAGPARPLVSRRAAQQVPPPAPTPVHHALTAAQLRDALARAAAQPGSRIVEHLGTATGLGDADLARALQAWLGWPLANAAALAQGHLGEPDEALVPLLDAVGRLCSATRRADGRTLLLLADPLDPQTRLWLRGRLAAHPRAQVVWLVVAVDALRAHLQRREQSTRVSAAPAEAAAGVFERPALALDPAAWSAEPDPVVRKLNATLYDALNARASDVHLACDAQGLNVHLRLDGVLVRTARFETREAARQAISRVKVLAELDIAEQRLPQDGRMALRLAGRAVDLRVSIMPGIHGEDAVLRVLDRQQLDAGSGQLAVRQLGLAERDAQFARRMAALPYGLFLVTGPTGSGKTTTLYALLSESHDGLQKIITIEDPVEYELPGVLQIPVNEAKGLSFARGLRSVLRHDPDRIMVGEIRDPETAQIALQAALTGHQVYATVHANNAVDVIGRLASMGVDPYNLAAALNGVLAQRLVRVLCSSCRGQGCGACRGTGYRGRRAVAETLRIDERLRSLIGERAPLAQIKTAVRDAGARSLRQAVLDLVAQGVTSLQEANRVTVAEDDGP